MDTKTPLNGLKPVKSRTLRHEVTDSLRKAIASGLLEPGQRLMEVDLAQELGVSRLPVREAIRNLEHEGLLVSIPHRGTFVVEVTESDIREMFSLREALEALAARLVAERANQEEVQSLQRLVDAMGVASGRRNYADLFAIDTTFHTQLCSMTGHMRLLKHWQLVYGQWQTLDSLMNEVPVLNALPIDHPVISTLDHFSDMHQGLVDAIEAHDPDLAEAMMRKHMVEAEQSTLAIHAAKDAPPSPLP